MDLSPGFSREEIALSAIFGIVRFDGQPVAPHDLQLMSETLAHRGPAEPEYWLEEQCGLGHSMLRTNGVNSAGLAVQQFEHRTLVVTAEGRLDNRAELLTSLGISEAAAAITDSELILRLYQRYQDNVPELLLGDFAFALYDSALKRLLCARDHMGVKPFYYVQRGAVFAFASGVEAIVALHWLDHGLNRQRIADYLVPALERVDNTSTFYRDVYRLPPAHRITFSNSTAATLQRYWQLDPSKELSFRDAAACTEAFGEQLEEAVARRLAEQSRVGIALSGGVDSGAITAVARRRMPNGGLRTYSGVSAAGEGCPETARLLAVIAQGGVTPSTLAMPRLPSLLGEVQRIAQTTPDPFDNKMTIYPALCAMASADGVSVMLDGVDDVIMDNVEAYTTYLLRSGHLRSAWRENRAMAQLSQGEQSIAGLFHADFRRLFSNPISIAWATKKHAGSDRADALQRRLISSELADEVDIAGRLRAYRETWPQQLCPSVRHANAIEVSHPFLTAAVERYDRLASRFGIEPRHPYLDRRFVEFCLALPWQYKDFRGWPKITLRRAMQGVLPKSSLWQRDGVHLGWRFNMHRVILLREEIIDILSADFHSLKDLINPVKLNALLEDLKAEDCREDNFADIWTAYTLALFLRRSPSL